MRSSVTTGTQTVAQHTGESSRKAEADGSRRLLSENSSSVRKLFKNPLLHSASFPVTTTTSGQASRLVSPRRPLPLTPPQQRHAHHSHAPRQQRLSLQSAGHQEQPRHLQHQEQSPRRELQRRETIHWFPVVRRHSRHSDNEEHIYEEIIEESGEEETKEEVSEHSFLALISLERRKHLKFYGRTDWDYGNERF